MLKMVQILLEAVPMGNECANTTIDSSQSLMITSSTKGFPMVSVIVTVQTSDTDNNRCA